MSEKIIYLNGGDGVCEVTRTFAHEPFRVREHTARRSKEKPRTA